MGVWSFFFVPEEGPVAGGNGRALYDTDAQDYLGKFERPNHPAKKRACRRKMRFDDLSRKILQPEVDSLGFEKRHIVCTDINNGQS
jgi:hypothetical protein